MDLETALRARSDNTCELCGSKSNLAVFEVKSNQGVTFDTAVLVCRECAAGMAADDVGDGRHFFGLREAIWSEFTAVKVLSYRILKRLGPQPWAQDLLTQIFLDDEQLAWADASVSGEDADVPVAVRDSNGVELQAGDAVTLIKDLDVKGANFTAKRGTTVKNISLTDDPKYVEGNVNGMRIVLVAAYLKKA